MSELAKPPPRTGRSAEHPSGDHRLALLDASMKRHHFRPDSLIEVLHTAQELFGFLKEDLLLYVARGLRLPPSRVYGVATFYHLFTFTPKGEHTCVICTGTACHVKGADALVAAASERAGVLPGKTTVDGVVSLETARCLGACGIAPIAVFDGEVVGKVSARMVLDRLEGWGRHGSD